MSRMVGGACPGLPRDCTPRRRMPPARPPRRRHRPPARIGRGSRALDLRRRQAELLREARGMSRERTGPVGCGPSSCTSTPPWASQSGSALSTAALARHSASSAVGASAVAWTTPVNAGRPVAGSSRWWAGRPLASSQDRRPIPLVATAPSRTSNTCSGGPPNGSVTSSRRGAPPKRRSPPQSTAKLPRIRSAIRSANRPLASPPLSIASPGGRRATRRAPPPSSRGTRKTEIAGRARGAAGRRGGASASASRSGSGAPRSPR